MSKHRAVSKFRALVVAAVACSAALVALTSTASANPSGVTNTSVPCTTTISTQVRSLVVSSGLTCIDGAHGGGVSGSISVGPGAGLYVEDATVGAITANQPQIVWECGGTTGSIAVSGATGLPDSAGEMTSVALGVNCPPAFDTSQVNGAVVLSRDLGIEEVFGTVTGNFIDTRNASSPVSSAGNLVDAAGVFGGEVIISRASGSVLVEYGQFHGPVTVNNNSAFDIYIDHNNKFYAGLSVVGNQTSALYPTYIADNQIHGSFVVTGNTPTPTVTNNTTF